tara:strand:- start:4242 stop:4367 length:126 start_codon:yes stop_codon:yes gene_type:complete
MKKEGKKGKPNRLLTCWVLNQKALKPLILLLVGLHGLEPWT